MAFYLLASRVMGGIMSERFGRVAVALIVAVMTTVGSLFLFTAGTRERFEPLDTAENASPQPLQQASLPQPGMPAEAIGETVVEENEAPAPDPIAETTRLRHALPIADFLTRAAGLNLFEAE